MINLNTCVKGQKLLLRNGKIVTYVQTYVQSGWSGYYPHATRTESEGGLSYTDEGRYYSDGTISGFDVAEILPLETTDKNPSVAWWESCPWIRDRKPTKEDSDEGGWVMTKLINSSSALTTYWLNVKVGDPWVHRPRWQPPILTNKEQALRLISNHEDGWRPTPEQWHIIRKGLEAS